MSEDAPDAIDPDTPSADPPKCDYCCSPIPREAVTIERDDTTYSFCCRACRDAMAESDKVFTAYRGHRWFRPGVAALEAKLPQGLLRNSFVLLSAQPGTRESELHAELVWRALQRDEPAVFVSFQEPPVSIVEGFLSLGWNVLPYLESGDLRILDCFTHRVEDRDRMLDRMNDWNAHLQQVAEQSVTAVQDPSDVRVLQSRLDDCTSELGMTDTGIVVLDSLTELGSLVQPIQAYDFVKDVRADVCKGRFVPVFASGSYRGDGDQFPHDLEYMFDGVIDMELNPEVVEDALIKRMRVRKMSGVLTYPEWTAYEFTSEDGLVMFDPQAEIEKKREESAEGGEGTEGESGAEDREATGDETGEAGGGEDDGPGDDGGASPDGG